MHCAVEEGEQSEHPPELHERMPSGEPSHRSDGNREAEKAEPPESGVANTRVERVHVQLVSERGPQPPGCRSKGGREDKRLQDETNGTISHPHARRLQPSPSPPPALTAQ